MKTEYGSQREKELTQVNFLKLFYKVFEKESLSQIKVNKFTQALITSHLTNPPDTPINIYLFACWTATSVKKTYKRGKSEPFAKRFSRSLAAAGFNKLRVIGFAGSVNGLMLK